MGKSCRKVRQSTCQFRNAGSGQKRLTEGPSAAGFAAPSDELSDIKHHEDDAERGLTNANGNEKRKTLGRCAYPVRRILEVAGSLVLRIQRIRAERPSQCGLRIGSGNLRRGHAFLTPLFERA